MNKKHIICLYLLNISLSFFVGLNISLHLALEDSVIHQWKMLNENGWITPTFPTERTSLDRGTAILWPHV